MNFIINIIKIIFLLGILVFIHEGGHFIIAKLCKVKVHEFAIGFGKTIWKIQGKETAYELKLIPLGGFVRMEGEEEKSEKEGSFSKASIPKRIAIVVAGGTVNIIFGLLIYFVLSVSSGTFFTNEIESIIPGYPADIINLMEGDKIIKIQNKKINTKQDINDALNNLKNQEVILLIERNGRQIEYKTKPTELEYSNETIYVLGINLKQAENTLANRIYYASLETSKFLVSIIDNIKQLFKGNIQKEQLMGPVGISNVVSETKGFENYIYVIALVSLSLGVTNLMPFPPLDGGKIILFLIEAIRKKPLNEKLESNIQITGFIILITLSVYITYNDIFRIF